MREADQYFLKNIEKPKIKNKQTIKHYPGLELWKSTQEKGNRKNELKNLNAFQLPNCKKKMNFKLLCTFSFVFADKIPSIIKYTLTKKK